MTGVALEIERFGSLLRDSIRKLRESGRSETERYRLMVSLYGELAALVAVMEAEGEIDPAEAHRIQETLTPEFKKLESKK